MHLNVLKDKFSNKQHYSVKEIKEIITVFEQGEFLKMDHVIVPGKLKPTVVRKGDIFFAAVGGTYHPAIVFKVTKTKAYFVGLTTDQRMGVELVKSRFFKDTYFSQSISFFNINDSNNRKFLGVFDNRIQLNKFLKNLKEYYNSIL